MSTAGMALHVLPIGDLVEHVSDDDCLCGPTAKPIKADDGSMQWLMIHPSLDGRELREADRSAGRTDHDPPGGRSPPGDLEGSGPYST